ncbi:MAG TPA: 5-formyltetrahydrofolate cyclo-ligase [Terriglobia bacterium]|nr:5-formyltetrahydrofolate cyclo-ligase [Terriglobia bacterium]
MLNPAPQRVPAWRRETRAALLSERQKLSPEHHHRASKAIEGLLKDLLKTIPARIVSAYWPFSAEVDLRGLMDELRAGGRITALPAVVRPRAPLEFLRWTSGAEMHSGAYGIPVPRVRDVVTPEVVIAPLVGFDRGNYRLGYGGGFFDITLSAMRPRPRTIGIGFELSRLDTIHPEETDIPMDFIVTEAGIHSRA